MASAHIFPSLQPFALFGALCCIHPQRTCLNAKCLQSMLLDGHHNWFYASLYEIDRLSAVEGWARCGMHWGGRAPLLDATKRLRSTYPFYIAAKRRFT